MIKILKRGAYQLVETKDLTKVFMLDTTNILAWSNTTDELIFSALVPHHKPLAILAQGKYFLYDVKEEPGLTDVQHLELLVGKGKWQGYLLPGGLPMIQSKRKKFIPTPEMITKSYTKDGYV